MSSLPQVVCSNVTLTGSFAAVNDDPVFLQGTWSESEGATTLLVKHVKHASQANGYPVVRIVWGYRLADDSLVPAHDPMLDPNTSESGGVTTVDINTVVANLHVLTDSDGSRWVPVEVRAPKWAACLYYLEAKQAGDTTNLGKIYAQLGRL